MAEAVSHLPQWKNRLYHSLTSPLNLLPLSRSLSCHTEPGNPAAAVMSGLSQHLVPPAHHLLLVWFWRGRGGVWDGDLTLSLERHLPSFSRSTGALSTSAAPLAPFPHPLLHRRLFTSTAPPATLRVSHFTTISTFIVCWPLPHSQI